MKRMLLLAVAILVWRADVQAQTDIAAGDLGEPTLVSPYYFGPNAFPVPDMLEGTASKDLRLELGSDYFHGFQGDMTADAYLKLNIPLFTDRVNLSAWMPVAELWCNSKERMNICRLDDPSKIKGHEIGEVYISTDIWLLKAERSKVDISIRAAMKTASSDKGFSGARYYDSPGYFFDASISKPFLFSGNHIKEFRISCSGGFLCWQTDNGRQNDAVMYGLALKVRTRMFTVRETFGGYFGWESFASRDKSIRTGDCPMSLKTDLIFHYKAFEFLLRYQVGLYDWPFRQFRFGIAYNLDILEGRGAH